MEGQLGILVGVRTELALFTAINSLPLTASRRIPLFAPHIAPCWFLPSSDPFAVPCPLSSPDDRHPTFTDTDLSSISLVLSQI